MLAVAAAGAWAQEATTRPHEPWVFRSVLDKHARMVTVALHEKLWVAYDAQTCSLYRAWPGGVKFTGAVYDMRHGPQPQSEGQAYEQLPAPGEPWVIRQGERANEQMPDYRGYTLDGTERVTFHYALTVGDTTATIDETPEAVVGADGTVQFQRTFEVKGLPAGVSVALYAGEKSIEREVAGAELQEQEGRVELRLINNGTATLTSRYPKNEEAK